MIRETVNISNTEDYVDIDSYNDDKDNVTINSDDAIEEEDGSKF